MKRTFIIGLFAMVIGGIGLFVCEQMGVNPQNTIFGVGTGVIAAIVRIGTPIERLAGYLIGLVLGTILVAMQFWQWGLASIQRWLQIRSPRLDCSRQPR